MELKLFFTRPRSSFLSLLLWFLLLFLLYPLLPDYYSKVFVNVTFSFLLLSIVFSLSDNALLLRCSAIIAVCAIAMNSYTLYHDTFWTEFVSILINLLFIGVASIVLFKRVFVVEEVNTDLIFGAVCIYILLGTLWALMYSFIELIYPASYIGLQEFLQTQQIENQGVGIPFQFFLYYSFVTQTTLGYGDITPILPIAKNLSAIQAIIGQFYVATLVAGLIGLLLKKK